MGLPKDIGSLAVLENIFYTSFMLAFIVGIPRTVKQDKCPISMHDPQAASFSLLQLQSKLPANISSGSGGGVKFNPCRNKSHKLQEADKTLKPDVTVPCQRVLSPRRLGFGTVCPWCSD